MREEEREERRRERGKKSLEDHF